jgi:hypothetical protein
MSTSDPYVLPEAHQWWTTFVLHVATLVSSDGINSIRNLLRDHSAPSSAITNNVHMTTTTKVINEHRNSMVVWRSPVDPTISCWESDDNQHANGKETLENVSTGSRSQQGLDQCAFVEVHIEFLKEAIDNEPGIVLRLGALTYQGWCLSSCTRVMKESLNQQDSQQYSRRPGHICEIDIRRHFEAVGFDVHSTPPEVLARLWVTALKNAFTSSHKNDRESFTQCRFSVNHPKTCWVESESNSIVSVYIPFQYPDAREAAIWCLQGRIDQSHNVHSTDRLPSTTTITPCIATRTPHIAMSMWLRCLTFPIPITSAGDAILQPLSSIEPNELLHLYQNWRRSLKQRRALFSADESTKEAKENGEAYAIPNPISVSESPGPSVSMKRSLVNTNQGPPATDTPVKQDKAKLLSMKLTNQQPKTKNQAMLQIGKKRMKKGTLKYAASDEEEG